MPKLNVLPDGFMDRVWNRLAEVDTDNCSRDEATEAIDEVCCWFNEVDAERFPIDQDSENEEDDDEQEL